MRRVPRSPGELIFERSVRHQGGQAIAWLAQMGCHSAENGPETRVYGDRLHIDDFFVSRVWRGPAFEEQFVPSWSETSISMFIVVDGEAILNRMGEKYELKKGSVVLNFSPIPIAIEGESSIARYFLRTSQDRFGLSWLPELKPFHVLAVTESHMSILGAVVNGIFGSDMSQSGWQAVSYVRTAVESIASGIVVSSIDYEMSGGTTSDRENFLSALVEIEKHAEDPEFDVVRLAEYVNLSRRQLERVLAVYNVTPARLIRRFRAARARKHLASNNATRKVDLEKIAQRSGFKTVQSMRSAIKQEVGSGSSD